MVSKPPRATRGLSAQQDRKHKQITSFLNDKRKYDSKLGSTMVKMCQAIYMPFILFTIVYFACGHAVTVTLIYTSSLLFLGFIFDAISFVCYE